MKIPGGLAEWIAGYVRKVMPTALTDLDTTVTGAELDADHAKLTGIEAGATADQTDAEIETAYNNQVAAVSQAEAEAGTVTAVRRWTPERVAQAVAALQNTAFLPNDGTHFTFDDANNLLKILDGSGVECARMDLDSQWWTLGQSLGSYAFDADVLDYIARAEALSANCFDLSAIDPTYTATYVKVAINEYVLGLKADGLWTKLTELYLLAGVQFGAITAKLKYDSVATLTNNGFVSGDYLAAGSGAGLTGDGSSKYLSTSYNGLTTNDQSLGHYATSYPSASAATPIGFWNGGSGIWFGQSSTVNFSVSGGIGSATLADGFWILTTRSSTDHEGYLNGTSVVASTTTKTIGAVSEINLFRLGGYASQYAATTNTMMFVGTGLTDTESANLSSRTNTLMAALGCNVYTGSYTDPTVNRPFSLGINLASPSTEPHSNLEVQGSVAFKIETLDADFTFDATHGNVVLDGTSNTVSGTLEDPTTCSGRLHVIVCGDATNTVTIVGTVYTDLSTSSTDPTMSTGDRWTLQSDGTQWWRIA